MVINGIAKLLCHARTTSIKCVNEPIFNCLLYLSLCICLCTELKICALKVKNVHLALLRGNIDGHHV